MIQAASIRHHSPSGSYFSRSLGLLVAAVVVGLVAGCNTSDFVSKVNVLLAAPGFNLQRLRSIETNRMALTKLDRVDLAVGLNADRLQPLVAGLANQDRVVTDLAKQGLSITGSPQLRALPPAAE